VGPGGSARDRGRPGRRAPRDELAEDEVVGAQRDQGEGEEDASDEGESRHGEPPPVKPRQNRTGGPGEPHPRVRAYAGAAVARACPGAARTRRAQVWSVAVTGCGVLASLRVCGGLRV